ncbi:hypothetical protein FNH25_08055 [Morganella morganii]|nr:hypothetical protein [Morganella morganii]
MTVSTELSHEEYTGNGVTTDFDFRFRIFEAKHLVVSVADPDGTERILTNGTDYTLRGVGSYRGGKVILKMPLAAGWKIGIARDLPVVQETDLRNQGKFFAEVHEDAFDYLTMLIQKSLGYLSLCLRKSSFISDHYDAKGNKISNLGKPVKDGDAVDFGTMKEHISAKDKRSLRVADKDIPVLPNAVNRANKLLSFDDGGNPVVIVPESGSAADVLAELGNPDFGRGDSLVAVKQTFAGAVARTQHDKNTDILSVKDFGAIGDGELHPLSERYTTLAEANSVYSFVTDLSQSIDYAGIQAAINAAKNGNMSVYIPAGGYVVNSTIVADYAPSIHGAGGQGLRDTSSSHAPSQVRGSVIHSRVKSGATLKISPEKYCFGLTLRDFAIWGIDGECDVGLQLDHIGWMGIVNAINIQYFPNQALKLGYIQDTYFTNCSFLASGNKQNPAVTCLIDANYVYFSGCHFELTPYMIKFDKCWNFCFDKCHFEVARSVDSSENDDGRFAYESACIDFGSSYRFQFTNNTWIPVDVEYLAKQLLLDRKDVPYFMVGNGTYFSFNNDIWLAPEGSINIGWFNIDHINFIGCQFIGLSPSRESIHISKRGKISESTLGISASSDEKNLYGCYVNGGSFTNNVFGFTSGSSGKRERGALLYGGCFASGNEYPVDEIINIYIDSTVVVSECDGMDRGYIDVSETGNIDLTKYPPGYGIRVTKDNVTIGHIYGAQLGRNIVVTTNGKNTILEYKTNSVLTQGSINYQLGQYRTVMFKCINAGVNVLQQVS